MKKLLIGLVMTAAATAQAQSSSATLPATTTAPASPTQTLTTAAPASTSKFGATLLWQSWVGVADLKDHNTDAPIDSDNGVGITYKVTDKLKTELRHRFEIKTARDRELLKDKEGKIPDVYKTLDPTIHANYTSDIKVFGSNPLVFANRYYIPVSEDSVDQTSNGVLRTQTSLDWDLNPRVSLSILGQLRLLMYRNNTTENGDGGDSTLYLLTGTSATYNFNDKFNVYYQPYLLTMGKGFQRGDYRADKMNSFWQEIGFNLILGPVTINPAYSTFASAMNQAGYSGMGSDANSEYDLNIIASF